MPHLKLKDLKSKKQDEAKIRQETYNLLTNKQKIELLDKKLGKGSGAKRQRKRLLDSK